MDKQVALITGASTGIGKAIALTLAKAGYYVVINYIGPVEAADEVVELIKADGGDGFHIMCDISDYDAVEAMMKEIIKETGGIDVLVNNAGITKDQLMLRMSERDFSLVIDINLKGTFNCVKHVTRSMFKQRSGCIVNISSVIGLVGNIGQVNYAASKAGVIGMTKSLAREYAARNIRVNAVAPGFIATEMTNSLADDVKKAIVDKIPLNRLGTPEDVANVVAFLASDNAKYMTGQVLAIDGGMTM
jgi:3-oxoacyl-[acyl-carrier protein] reductase